MANLEIIIMMTFWHFEESERVLDFFENMKAIGFLERAPERESLQKLLQIRVKLLPLFIITSLDGTDNFNPYG
jgi:hypothetical protein